MRGTEWLARMDPGLREWLFAREMMRKLGFQPDEIFIAVQEKCRVIENGEAFVSEQPLISLILKSQGREFSWSVALSELPAEKLQQAYEEACEFWNNDPDDDWRDAGLQASVVFQRRILLVQRLTTLGFTFCKDWN